MTAEGALAAKVFPHNAIRLDPYKLTATDPAAVKGCTDKGGTVMKDEHGNTICAFPAGDTTVNSGK